MCDKSFNFSFYISYFKIVTRQEAEEAEKGQDEKRQQEAGERKRETGDIKALIQEQNQMQGHTTTELVGLRCKQA